MQYKNIYTNVLKIRPNRTVQPVGLGTGDESGWINLSKLLMGQNRKNQIEPLKPVRTK